MTTLSAGVRLGPYEIVEALGAGGMGEVYKARDTRLNRTVAIKVLPPHLKDDPDFRQRLTREAQAVSALQHPHICVLHDIGQHEGVDFLVMEYLEGETLADRLEKGPLPIDQALRYAVQIADALDKAHRQHIVHRDLKPGNVMLTPGGPKLLDFGLAKRRLDEAASGGSMVTGLKKSLTGQGVIVGTLQYMSPEQLNAQPVDARSDVFAFGAVLYEMVTGKTAFEGPSQASVIAAILEHDPPRMATAQPSTPPVLEHIVRRCLEKDPDERWQTSADLSRELKWVGEVTGHAQEPTKAPVGKTRLSGLAWPAAVLLLGAGLGAAAAYLATRQAAAPPVGVARVEVPLTPAASLMLARADRSGAPVRSSASLSRAPALAISRDGRQLVFVGYGDGRSRLYLRRIDRFEAAPLAGTEGADGPFFSPDGQWVGFFAQGQLKKIAVSGGASAVLAPAQSHRGGTWGSDGTIVFAAGSQSGLSSVAAEGGEIRPITTVDHVREHTHRFPEFLPDGKTVIFTVGSPDVSTFDDARIEVLSLATGERKVVVSGAGYARFAVTGHLVYPRAGVLFAVPFDVSRLELSGPSVEVLRGVTTWPATGHAEFAISADGSLIYAPGEARHRLASLLWVTPDGRAETITREARAFSDVRVSPEGRRIAMVVDTGVPQVWMLEVERQALSRLARPTMAFTPVWTSGGTRVAFAAREAGTQNIYQQVADGSTPAQRITQGEHAQLPWSWSDALGILAFEERGDIWTRREGEGSVPQRFLETPATELHPVFSPDGRWLAYVSDESGRSEVHVRPYPGPGARYEVSTLGGDDPKWSRDGRQLFYREPPGRWMAVDIRTEPTWQVGKPRLLFEGPYDDQYDIAPDGRFLVIRPEPLPPVTRLQMVQRWFEELTQTRK